MALLDRSIAAVPIELLGPEVRTIYRSSFMQALTRGEARPLVLPHSILGVFILPTLWLAIPHTKSRWMRLTTYLVATFVVTFNLHIILRASSTNMACAYACGLMGYWGIISTLNVLIWARPQTEAARVAKRITKIKVKHTNGHVQRNGDAPNNELRQRTLNGDITSLPEEQSHGEYEYFWQAFPTDASFSERLNWALDMMTNFRFAGWNWSISSIPGPKGLPTIGSFDEPIRMDSIPIMTRSGYRRCLTESDFLRTRLCTAAIMYLILDLLAVIMMKDPYFILGPDIPYPLPTHLLRFNPFFLHLGRQVMCLAGILSAISAIFNLNDVVQYHLLGGIFPMRKELWQYPSTFGSFGQVFERGLAGFWGGWWHQTFRLQFCAPSVWLMRKGYVKTETVRSTLVTLLVSFLQSGFLHASGSYSTIPKTKVWRSPAFFLLQVLGIMIQQTFTFTTKKRFPAIPRNVAWGGNILFTLAWLHYTADLFCDDLASAGIWLLEPVPFSFIRALGFGYPGDHWWRWDRHHWPRIYSGEHWWLSGIAL